jgi:hypothetical protein
MTMTVFSMLGIFSGGSIDWQAASASHRRSGAVKKGQCRSAFACTWSLGIDGLEPALDVLARAEIPESS